MANLTYTEELIVTSCWCGIPLAIPDNRYRWMKESERNSCYCPNGHTFVFNDSYEKKLERERRQHQATRELLAAEERSHSATKGQMTRLRKRVEHGICPHCKRSFQNLQRHVATKHPECLQA